MVLDKDRIAKSLIDVERQCGLTYHEEYGYCISSKVLDEYLLVAVLSEMIEFGDIQLNVIGDTTGRKSYLLKLLNSECFC